MTTTNDANRLDRLMTAHGHICDGVRDLRALAKEPAADSAELVEALHFLDTGSLWLIEAIDTADTTGREDLGGLARLG